MSEVDNFISTVKEIRNDALDYLTSEEYVQNLCEDPREAAAKGVDTLVGGMLDLFEERYHEIITAETDSGDDVTITCISDLSTRYFEEVNS